MRAVQRACERHEIFARGSIEGDSRRIGHNGSHGKLTILAGNGTRARSVAKVGVGHPQAADPVVLRPPGAHRPLPEVGRADPTQPDSASAEQRVDRRLVQPPEVPDCVHPGCRQTEGTRFGQHVRCYRSH